MTPDDNLGTFVGMFNILMSQFLTIKGWKLF